MRKSRGYALIDAMIGLFAMICLVSLVLGLYKVRSAFVYDLKLDEMRNLWENSAYTKIYIPRERKTEEEPQEPVLPSLNS